MEGFSRCAKRLSLGRVLSPLFFKGQRYYSSLAGGAISMVAFIILGVISVYLLA